MTYNLSWNIFEWISSEWLSATQTKFLQKTVDTMGKLVNSYYPIPSRNPSYKANRLRLFPWLPLIQLNNYQLDRLDNPTNTETAKWFKDVQLLQTSFWQERDFWKSHQASHFVYREIKGEKRKEEGVYCRENY